MVNARVALDNIALGGADVCLALWAHNLFDEDTPRYIQGPGDGLVATHERARTFGVELTVDF